MVWWLLLACNDVAFRSGQAEVRGDLTGVLSTLDNMTCSIGLTSDFERGDVLELTLFMASDADGIVVSATVDQTMDGLPAPDGTRRVYADRLMSATGGSLSGINGRGSWVVSFGDRVPSSGDAGGIVVTPVFIHALELPEEIVEPNSGSRLGLGGRMTDAVVYCTDSRGV